MRGLEGKIAIVTGGGAGQGAQTVRALAALGAKVVATGRRLQPLEEVVASVNAEEPGRALAVRHDVSSTDDWARVVTATTAAFGPATILVNNAGILNRAAFDKATLEQWQETMNINAWGVFAGMQAVVPGMRSAGIGSIINISSTVALNGAGGLNAYTASKGAIDAMTRAAAIELASANIRVNGLNAGIIHTAMIELTLSTEAARKAAASTIPIGRLGRPSDIASLVAYLAGDESGFITGASLVIDGGASVEGGRAVFTERMSAAL